MVGIIKKIVGCLVAGSELHWEEELNKEIYGYRRRPLDIRYSLYDMMYGKSRRLVFSDHMVGYDTPVSGQFLESVATLVVHAERALASEAQRE